MDAKTEYRNPVFTDQGQIDCEVNHPDLGWIPITLTEPDYPELFAVVTAAQVAPFVPPAVTSEQVNAECDRRIWAFLGVSNKVDALAKQTNYSNIIQAMQITIGSGGALSDEQLVRMDAILAGYAHIQAMVAASNTLAAMTPIPADYASDHHWPTL